ncbi:cadherin-like beta sandwich domain-containing protein, partial [Bacteroidales bacterium OttesenSCG-928-L14]|nr:cadherin-like beta sandwich domain-containing protein [Bacteroidales bacterium OttesenSCG-928-L14]
MNKLLHFTRRIAIMLIVILASTNLFAKSVDTLSVKLAAQHFFMGSNFTGKSTADKKPEVKILHTEHSLTDSSNPYYYVLTKSDGEGWIILSGDDRISPIVGYSQEGKFYKEGNPAFSYWMENFKEGVDRLRSSKDLSSEDKAKSTKANKEWAELLSGPSIEIREGTGSKGYTQGDDLLFGITWDQGGEWSPFSYAPAGCIATAMGQVMHYWATRNFNLIRWQGEGYFEYFDCGQNIKRSVDFGSKLYEFPLIGGNFPTQGARDLLYDLGVSVQMSYEPGISSTISAFIPYAMQEHFGFTASRLEQKKNYSDAAWEEMIRAEIYAERPVIYSGNDGNNVGHSFIISGNSNNLFYINWGYGGRNDMWFHLSSTGYPDNVDAIINLEPRIRNNYTPSLEYSNIQIYTTDGQCQEKNVFLQNGGSTYLSMDIKNNTNEPMVGNIPVKFYFRVGNSIGGYEAKINVSISANSAVSIFKEVTDIIDLSLNQNAEYLNVYIGGKAIDGTTLFDMCQYPFLLSKTNNIACSLTPIKITDVRPAANGKIALSYNKPFWCPYDSDGTLTLTDNYGTITTTTSTQETGTITFDYRSQYDIGGNVKFTLTHTKSSDTPQEAKYTKNFVPQIESFNAYASFNDVKLFWNLHIENEHICKYGPEGEIFQIECYDNSNFSGNALSFKEVAYIPGTCEYSTDYSVTIPESGKLYFRIRYKSQGTVWGWNYKFKTCEVDFNNLDKITINWTGETDKEKVIIIGAPKNKKIIVDWGDGNYSIFDVKSDYTQFTQPNPYQTTNTYTATIMAMDPSCDFTFLMIDRAKINSIDLTEAINLTYLALAHNENLNSIDLSQNTNLERLELVANSLTSIDLSNNLNLQQIVLSSNQLSSIELGKNTNLQLLAIDKNKLTDLNLKHLTSLMGLICNENELTELNIKNNPELVGVQCYDNHIPLTDLYSISQQISKLSDKLLGTQTHEGFDLNIGDNCYLPNCMVVGGTQTDFAITKDGQPAINGTDYTIDYVQETISFLTSGNYEATLTNTTISSKEDYPAKFIYPFIVGVNNTNISNLTVSPGTLTPDFVPYRTNYTVLVENSVSEITIEGTPRNPAATVSGNGTFPLNVGPNNFDIVVTAENGITTKTYTIVVTREFSDDANLLSLTASPGTLTPAFNAETTNYTVTVESTVSDITITGTTNHAGATVSGNGTLPLTLGENTFDIVVTAEDGTTTKTYTVVVTRGLSNNANLSSLTVSQGSLNPIFNSETTNYTVSVEESLSEITIEGTPKSSGATVSGNGTFTLELDLQSFDIVVTAEDGTTTKTYTVVVKRGLSNDADLLSLIVSHGTLTPEFNANITSYMVIVESTVSEITITGVANYENATISGNGTFILELGSNSFEIVVTAENGTTTKTYTVVIIRSWHEHEFIIQAEEAGDVTIANKWATDISVIINGVDLGTVAANSTITLTVATNDIITVRESNLGTTFRLWEEPENSEKPFVSDIKCKIIAMPTMSAFTTNVEGTKAGDNFFRGFNYKGSLTSLPEGSFKTDNITTVEDFFFSSFYSYCPLTSLPEGSFKTDNITTVKNFFFYGFNFHGSLTSLPEGSFNTAAITSVGSCFFSRFNESGSLTSLPEVSFKTNNITKTGSHFFVSFNEYGLLTSLPEGSFNTDNITTAPISFFAYFNSDGALTSLPVGSFNTSAITSVGDNFFYYFNGGGLLTSLPTSFALPASPTKIGIDYCQYMFYNSALTKGDEMIALYFHTDATSVFNNTNITPIDPPAGSTVYVNSSIVLSVSGITVDDKMYDGNTSATLNLSAATLVGVTATDDVSIDISGVTANFANAAVGVNKTVTVTGSFALSGADAGKYLLEQPNLSSLKASIKPWSDAALKSLTVSEGSLSPVFDSLTFNYNVTTVAYAIESLTIIAEANNDYATVAGDGEKQLNVGDNTFNIVVTAQDGTTTKTYTVNVRRQSNDATLNDLTVNEGTLSPAFAAATFEYQVTVGYDIDDIEITGTANHANATVSGDGNKTGLIVGDNVFTITVTAEDNSYTQDYVVTVRRQSNDATLA